MKKILILIVVACMSFVFVASVSAASLEKVLPVDISTTEEIGDILYFGDENIYVNIPISEDFVTVDSAVAISIGKSERYKIKYDAVSSNPEVLSACVVSEKYVSGDNTGLTLKLLVSTASKYFTVDEIKVNVAINIYQYLEDTKIASSSFKFKTVVTNKTHYTEDFEFENGDLFSNNVLTHPVISDSVFSIAAGHKLFLDYDGFSIEFPVVKYQNTSLYLAAAVGEIKNKDVIASVSFKQTRIKDNVIVTVPISADNENYYGEKVYVYYMNGSNTIGDPIEATIKNHNVVVFQLNAGSMLGSYAVFGNIVPDAVKTNEIPSIPETGV